MLDPKITALADAMNQVQFEERKQQLERDINLSLSELASRGLGHSSAVVQTTYDHCFRDVELRTLIVWQNLRRVLSTVGVEPSEGLPEDMKNEVKRHHLAIYSYPDECFQKVVRNVGITIARPLTDAWDRAIQKVNTEIDLFVFRSVDKRGSNSLILLG